MTFAAEGFPETYDVIIDVGHGGVDGGTSVKTILEKDINLAIGKKFYEKLQEQSFNVGITRLQDYALSDDSPFLHMRSRHQKDLTQRKLIADTLNPKIFVSLHVNWAKNQKRRGPVVIYQASEKSYTLSQVIQQHLNQFYGTRKAPIKGNTYYLMKHLDMPSIIVEMGYISNPKDLQMLMDEETQEKIRACRGSRSTVC
nr:N-acetylmuramoyl-L-alanine amidase [Ammoniphilus resinae]